MKKNIRHEPKLNVTAIYDIFTANFIFHNFIPNIQFKAGTTKQTKTEKQILNKEKQRGCRANSREREFKQI